MTLSVHPIQTIHGVVQNNSVIPGVCVVTQPQTLQREREQEMLLLHVTVTGSLEFAAELQNQLVDVFVETYYSTAGTINATLRHAVHAVNAHLLSANVGEEEPRTAVLCGVVVREGEVRIVQVGQAQTLIGTADGIEEMTDYAPKRLSPLGMNETIDFSLYHTSVTRGDTILILAPNLVDIPTQRIKPIIVNQPFEQAEQRLMHLLTHRTARCILAQITIAYQPISAYDPPRKIEEKKQHGVVQPIFYNAKSKGRVSNTIGKWVEGNSEQDTQYDDGEAYNVDNGESFDDAVLARDKIDMDGTEKLPTGYGMGEEQPTVFTPLSHTPSRPSDLVDEDQPPTLFYHSQTEPEQQSDPKMQHDLGELSEDLIAAEAIRRRRRTMIRTEPELVPPSKPALPEPSPKPSLDLGREPDIHSEPRPVPKPAVKMPNPIVEKTRQWSAMALYWVSRRVESVARALGRFNSADEATATERWFSLTFAVLIPLVVMIIITSAWLQREQNLLIRGIRNDVETAIQRLDMVQTPAQKQVYYNYIVDQIEIAENYEKNDEQLNSWKIDSLTRLDQINGMVNLKSDRIVDYGNRVTLKSFVLGSEPAIGFYTLDTRNTAVLYTPSDNSAAPTTLIQSKDAAGTYVVGDIIDIVWRDIAQGESGISLLDRGGALVTQYADGSREVLTMGLSSEWITPVRMAMYTGRVYVLDRGNAVQDGRIWRYVPTTNGLNIDKDKPAIVLPDLDQAVDFAITNDGNIIVLYEDGRIRRYTTNGNTVTTIWDETTVRNSGLHQPMVAPRALALSNTGFQPAIFILDSGSGRIIQISPAGILQGQYRAPHQQNINDDIVSRALDITVQTAPLRVYLLTETELFLAQD